VCDVAYGALDPERSNRGGCGGQAVSRAWLGSARRDVLAGVWSSSRSTSPTGRICRGTPISDNLALPQHGARFDVHDMKPAAYGRAVAQDVRSWLSLPMTHCGHVRADPKGLVQDLASG
jgi:hypothetical protein